MEDDLLPESYDEHPKREVVIILAVFFEFGLAPISLFLGWWLGHPPLKTFEWSPEAAVWGVLAAVPLILMFLAILRWPVGPLARVKDFCDYEVVPLLEQSSWSDIALISLSVGVCEEMLFRGVIQASLIGLLQYWLGDWWGVPCGLGLASLFFGLFHPITFTYMVIVTILGLYLGTVWIFGGNLLTVMITHALYDFAALAYILRIRPPGGVDSAAT
jgi:membrane protease YdiL (CAAX protease family)